MASRTRNRVLGIAALMGATVATVLLILLSHGSDGAPVTPLREETKKQEQRGERSEEAGTGSRWLVTPGSYSGAAAQRDERVRSGRRGRKHELPARTGGRRTGKRLKRHEGIQRARSRSPRSPRRSNPSPPAVAVPVPGPAPPSAAPIAAEPVPAEQIGPQPGSVPQPTILPKPKATPEPRLIEIEDGEIEGDVDRVYAQGGHVRLRVRSDRLVIVEVEDHPLSGTIVPAGGEALIEFDTPSTKGIEVELRRRKGVLVLRIGD